MGYQGPQRRTKRHRRAAAASSIQQGWRARNRRKRGSLLSRTSKANRVAIRKINKQIERKYCTSTVGGIGPPSSGLGQIFNFEVDANGTDTSVPATPQYVRSNLTAGIGGENGTHGELALREGNTVFMKYIAVHLKLTANAHEHRTDQDVDRVTILAVLDRDGTRSAAPLLTDMFQMVSTDPIAAPVGIGLPQAFYDPLWVSKTGRFKVLYRKTLVVASVVDVGAAPPPTDEFRYYGGARPSLTHRFVIKGNYKLDYQGDNNLTALNQSIYFFAFSNSLPNQPLASVSLPSLNVVAKLVYIDP